MLKVVGLGTQDGLDAAKDFVSDTGVTHQLVWDDSGESWRFFEIAIQPASVLVAPDGSLLLRSKFGLKLDDALNAAEG